MYFITEKGFPVKSNRPAKNWIEITEEEYIQKSAEINAEAERQRQEAEEKARPQREYNQKLQDKMKELAKKELEKEGIYEPE